jgi:hypothetical protein
MTAIFSFQCARCGKLHEGSPSFSFRAPHHYTGLSEEQKSTMGKLSEDFCSITHDEGTDYFIRTILKVPIHGVAEPFLWGVWVSLSKNSFDRYAETYDAPVAGESFFGWVCNNISCYPTSVPRAADVIVQPGRERPKLFLHQSDDEQDQLVIDQRDGISVDRARELAEKAMHGN